MKVVTAAILGLVAALFFVHWVKPLTVYDEEGNFREFGLGSSKKTVTPMWLVVLLTAITSYAWFLLRLKE
jgi:hypothetical protein